MSMIDPSILTLPEEKILQKRFHVISGKGGVGKSMVSIILGMLFASRGLKTLICEVDSHEQLSTIFGKTASGGNCIALHEDLPSLYGVNIQFQSALNEYAMMKLKFKTIHQLLLKNPLMKALVALVPGVQDLVSLGKAFHHEREQGPQGSLWDRIIVDAPATGHGFTFLSLPKIIQQSVRGGNLRQEADAMWSLISNQKRCAIHLVSLPEEMSVQESLELEQALQNELELSIQHIWINRFPTLCFSKEEEAQWQVVKQDSPHSKWLEYTPFIQYQNSYYEWAQQRVQPLYQRSCPISVVSQLPGSPNDYINLLLQNIAGHNVCQ
jgi:anion-transporting  ArsA/GET3 family ATPase